MLILFYGKLIAAAAALKEYMAGLTTWHYRFPGNIEEHTDARLECVENNAPFAGTVRDLIRADVQANLCR